ncbi:MAG: UDP-N-acetylglucosamine 2-epimerase (non-hydrolyzing) [Cyclobacteriaceae bacterium]|nr:UDP-N-acetylglucosamine 2-epimerase (non-hydrolyzing) [Cyclobacteriaceae bacterium]
MKLTLVAGARPNFMKIAPLIHALDKAKAAGGGISYQLVHTGQHYDKALSAYFFEDLGIPLPKINLGAGSGSQAEQTASIMVAFENYLLENVCDAVIVVGDVNSTLACAVVAKKMNIDVIHVEGGIRSGDRSMPEEINRLVTDAISDYFFTTTPEAGENLIREGIDSKQIFFVGNTMIDSLVMTRHRWQKPKFLDEITKHEGYLVLTLHRPSNVDNPKVMQSIIDKINLTIKDIPIIFPVHPRTQSRLALVKLPPHVHITGPMRYLEFMYLLDHCKGVITDSGGIQEETTFLHKPCVTLRDTTERPETVLLGTNELIGNDSEKLAIALNNIISGKSKEGTIPQLWDGRTAERIVAQLITIYHEN